MDGLALIQEIRTREMDDYTYIILITSREGSGGFGSRV